MPLRSERYGWSVSQGFSSVSVTHHEILDSSHNIIIFESNVSKVGRPMNVFVLLLSNGLSATKGDSQSNPHAILDLDLNGSIKWCVLIHEAISSCEISRKACGLFAETGAQKQALSHF